MQIELWPKASMSRIKISSSFIFVVCTLANYPFMLINIFEAVLEFDILEHTSIEVEDMDLSVIIRKRNIRIHLTRFDSN